MMDSKLVSYSPEFFRTSVKHRLHVGLAFIHQVGTINIIHH